MIRNGYESERVLEIDRRAGTITLPETKEMLYGPSRSIVAHGRLAAQSDEQNGGAAISRALRGIPIHSDLDRRAIVFVINCFDVGGAEVQVVRLGLGLRKRGWEVAVVSLVPPGPLKSQLRQARIPVHSLDMRAGIPNPVAVFRLARILRRYRPRIVHSHIAHANFLTRLTRLVKSMNVLICTAHNVQEGGPTFDLTYRCTDRLADLTTNVSQAAVDRYVQVKAAPASRIRFMPNGLDTSIFKPEAAKRQAARAELGLGDEFVWLAVGRFQEQKDYPNMLRAFAAARRQTGFGKLLIAGIGPLQNSCRTLAESLDLRDRVRFLGLRSDVPALLGAADGFLLSSSWEGMPLVLQEAASSELPIVATKVGGNAEVVQDGASGLLVPPRSEMALGSAMVRIMQMSPADRLKMGRAGRDFIVKNFEMEHVLDLWEQIYHEFLDRSYEEKTES